VLDSVVLGIAGGSDKPPPDPSGTPLDPAPAGCMEVASRRLPQRGERGSEDMADPRVVFLMTTYQHERFVEAAMRSVLAQDYEPLEILVSDDCSTDRTWEILQDLVADHDGPHRVTLNRNETRQALNHRYVYLALAGEGLIVYGHGDDVFFPDRVSRLVGKHRETGALAVSSQAHKIDAEGARYALHPPKHIHELGDDCSIETYLRARLIPTCFGAGLMWHSDLFETFGPIPRGPRNLDEVIPFRAALLGKADYIPEPLLEWRRHDANLTLQFQRSEDETRTLAIREREIQNKMANVTVFIHDTMTLEQKTGDSARLRPIRATLTQHQFHLAQQTMQMRHELACRGWGIM